MIDSTDKQLIELLQEDSRQTSEALAQKVNVSPSTVRRRVRKLIHRGTIRTVVAIDPHAFGLHLATVIGLDVFHQKLDAVMQFLAAHPQVSWVSTTTGRFDIMAVVRFASTQELGHFLRRELPEIEGVRNSETFVCLEIAKMRYTLA